MIDLLNLLAHFETDIEFDGLFHSFSIFSLIAYILSGMIPIIIIITVIKAIKAGKNKIMQTENNTETSPQVEEPKKEEEKTFIVCEYCGSNNNKTSIKCEGCGASLNHKK